MTAEMSILHGWLSKEDGDEVAAQHYFTAALGAAAEADNNDLGAYAAASASTLKAFRSSPHDSLQLLTTTNLRGIDMARASTATRIWIACLEAEVHTRTGSRSPALKALDRADALLHRLDPNDGQRPVLGHFDQASLMGERGVTAARLNVPSEAIPALDTALAGLAQYPKTQSRILTSTARAHLTHGDVDQATAAALQSLDIAEQTGSQVGINSIHDLRREMRPYANTTSVQLLDQRLAQV
jgi:hypothetical protein